MIIKRIFILSFLLLILSGCSSTSGNPSDTRLGYGGLEVEIMPESLAVDWYEGEDVTLFLNMKNTGSEDIINSKIVVGTQRDIVSNNNPVRNFAFEGLRKNPYGDQINEPFDLTIGAISATDMQETNIAISYCYPYKTIASLPVCIKSDLTNSYDDIEMPAYCDLDTYVFSGGQGAPVTITQVTPRMIPSQGGVTPSFEIVVENHGSGRIVNQNVYEDACSGKGIGMENYGVIDISGIYLGNEVLSCTRSKLRIDESTSGSDYYDSYKSIVKCKGSFINKGTPKVTELQINLKYGYKENFEETMIVYRK